MPTGFGDRPVPAARQPKTIRIAFLGARRRWPRHYPYSYPEYVGYWLNRWAAAKKLDLKFEVLNAGRERQVLRHRLRHEKRGGTARTRSCGLLRGRQPVRIEGLRCPTCRRVSRAAGRRPSRKASFFGQLLENLSYTLAALAMPEVPELINMSNRRRPFGASGTAGAGMVADARRGRAGHG